ncbi:MAG: S-layer homology domain-containing protein [Clostridia bacterium]|nr:S-layer homology domain-containing protein [Clostridia bacterium]
MKKTISVLLMVCMLIGILPVAAFADGAPVITAQPQDATIVNGQDAVYTVTAEGEDLTYLWYRYVDGETDEPLWEGEYFIGTETATLTVVSVLTVGDGDYDCNYNGDQYYCVVSNEYGEVQSDIVEYIVTDHPQGYDYDYEGHWSLCGCFDDYEAHEDTDGDFYCDVCDLLYVHPFVDVTNPEVWYYEAAEHGRWNGYFKGNLAGLFNGDSAITRAEAVTVIARAFWNLEGYILDLDDGEYQDFIEMIAYESGLEEPVTFTDVEGTWYERCAVALANFGFINGYGDGSFRGDQLITRQEIAAILYRFNAYVEADMEEVFTFGTPVDAYADADKIANWAEPYVEWAAETGLFQGDPAGNFNPEQKASRAEFAQLMLRYDTGRYIFDGGVIE